MKRLLAITILLAGVGHACAASDFGSDFGRSPAHAPIHHRLKGTNTPPTPSYVQNLINGQVIANGKGDITGPVMNNVLTNILSVASNPIFNFALGGDCSTTAGSSFTTCLSTNGMRFGSLATLTPGSGVATALGLSLNGTGSLVAANAGVLPGGLTYPYTFIGANASQSAFGSVLNAIPVYAGPEYGVVANNSGAATANATAINHAIQNVNELGGGTVILPCGSVYVGSALLNDVPGVTVSGCWSSSPTFHNTGSNGGVSTEIVPTMSGPVLEHYTPSSPTTSTFSGGGFVNMAVIGNGVAGPLLYVKSVTNGNYDLFLEDSVAVAAAEFTSGVSGTDCGEACDIQGAHINLRIRQFGTGTPQSIGGVLITGSSNANFSFNNDVALDIQNCNGIGAEFQSADNNFIRSIRVGNAGGCTGKSIQMDGPNATYPVGGDSNHFGDVSAPTAIYAQGTDTSGVTAGVHNQIDALDVGNGSPTPTYGTSSGWVYRSDLSNVQQQAGATSSQTWPSWTPTLASSGGTQPTFALLDAIYLTNNNETRFYATFHDVTDTAGSGCLTMTLPGSALFPSTATGTRIGAFALQATINQDSNVATICKYDGTYPGQTDTYFTISGSYVTH